MPRIVAIDTGIILFLVVGLFGERAIKQHKRLSAYTLKDYQTLQATLESFNEMVVLPNTVTEASNLLDQTNGAVAPLIEAFATLVTGVREIYLPSVNAVARPEFARHDVADCASIELATQDIHILTLDGPLHRTVSAAGLNSIHFIELTEAYQAKPW